MASLEVPLVSGRTLKKWEREIVTLEKVPKKSEATTTVLESFTNSTGIHLCWSLFFSLK